MTTLESRSYAPYGEPFGLTGTNQTPYGFTGEHTDPTTGLLYLRARYYAPGLGAFISLDPFEGMAGRPMSLNGYSWVEGNPVMSVDPSGYLPCDEFANEPWRQSICLHGIYGKLQNIQAGGGFAAIFGQGTHLASYFLSHYLSGTGQDIWVIPSQFTFSDIYFEKINGYVFDALKASPGISNLANMACNCGGKTGLLISLTDQAFFSRSGVTDDSGAGLYYAYGGGGITVRSALPTTILGMWTGENSFVIRSSTQIEVYDKYDWCFGSGTCSASQYHFGDIPVPITGERTDDFLTTVGEFFALEEAGWAAQFDLYSGWNVIYTIEVRCDTGELVFTPRSVERQDIPGINQDTGPIPRPFKALSESGYIWQKDPAADSTLDCDDTITPGVCR